MTKTTITTDEISEAFDGSTSQKTANLERVDPTPEAEKAWGDTKAAFLWSCGFFSEILYKLMADSEGRTVWWTRKVPIAATDDRYLYLNPDKFPKYTLEERVFIVAHEVLHAMWAHCSAMSVLRDRGSVVFADGSSLPYMHDYANIAADLIINDTLIESGIGKFNPEWLHNTELATSKDNLIDVYRRVYQANGGGKGKRFDEHLEPGTGDGVAPKEAREGRDENEWRVAVAAALHAAKSRGDMPGGVERLLKELMEPKVSWVEHLRAIIANKLGNDQNSWRTLDPSLVIRGIGAPGRVGFGCDRIVVAVDTSGSITQEVFDQFIAEAGAILDEIRPKELYLMQCDYAVHEVRECTSSEDLKGTVGYGGGGTSFVPVFDKIDNMFGGDIDYLVYLTDMYGLFPDDRPSYPVLWANTTPKEYNTPYPWGDMVHVDFSVT